MEVKDKSQFRTVEDAARALPYFMKLPIVGFKNPKYHCFVTTDHFKMVIDEAILGGVVGTKAASHGISTMAKKAFGGFLGREVGQATGIETSVSDTLHNTGEDWFAMNLITTLFGYTVPFWKYFFTIVVPRLNFALSNQFHGVQFVMQMRGLTHLKDERINSFSPEAEIHRILTPWEFILFNHPVHSATDGEVTEIINDYEDKVRYAMKLDFGSLKPDDFLGNMIKIKYSFGINCIYAGLKKHSMTVKVGDMVKAGETIARVGCSGEFPYPVCFFAVETPGFKIPIAGNMRAPLTRRKQLWDTHLYAPLLDEFEFTAKDPHFFESIHPGKVQYKLTSGRLYDASFVKQFPVIHVE